MNKEGGLQRIPVAHRVESNQDDRQTAESGELDTEQRLKEVQQRLRESEQRNRILLEEAGLRQAEDVLREMRGRAQRYLDTVEAIMVSLDTEGNITLVNRKGCEILGLEQEDVLGQNWFDNFLPQEDREAVGKVFQEIMSGNLGPVEYYENPVITRKGERRIIAWHNGLLRDKGGRITGILSAGEDITERKRIENKAVELLAQNRELTHRLFHIQERERSHLARELHDENSQWLTALRMHARLLAEHLGGKDPEMQETIKDIEDISLKMQQSIRAMIRKLRAVDFDELGLKGSLEELVGRWRETYPGIHCVLDMKGDLDRVNRNLGVTVYRIVQESLTNVARHSGAGNVSVRIRVYKCNRSIEDCIIMRIIDDGKGFDLDIPAEGFGLAGMRERTLAARGEFFMRSHQGSGVLTRIRLPAASSESEADSYGW